MSDKRTEETLSVSRKAPSVPSFTSRPQKAATETAGITDAAMKIDEPARDKVFISYSHQDIKWLERLQVHLKPLEREGRIERWDDSRIQPGMDWRGQIQQALDTCAVAVLLVSADFLASDFIAKEELPPLLAAAEEMGAIIIPVIVSYSRFSKTASLSRFQSINPPSSPLIGMKKAKQEALFNEVAEAVLAAAESVSVREPVGMDKVDRVASVGKEDEERPPTKPWNVPATNRRWPALLPSVLILSLVGALTIYYLANQPANDPSLLPSHNNGTANDGDKPTNVVVPASSLKIEPPSPKPPREEPDDKQRLDVLYTSAKAQLAKVNLTTPPGDNAWETFNEMLEIDKKDKRAIAGIKTIGDRYAELAREQQRVGNLKRAMTMVQRGLKIDDKNSTLLKLQQQLLKESSDQQKDKKIQLLLARAEQQVNAGNYVRPAGDNALESYNTAQSLDPKDERIIEGFRNLVERISGLASEQKKLEDWQAALELLEDALLIAPQDTVLAQKKNEITELSQQTANDVIEEKPEPKKIYKPKPPFK